MLQIIYWNGKMYNLFLILYFLTLEYEPSEVIINHSDTSVHSLLDVR